jgi:hypothetical protein
MSMLLRLMLWFFVFQAVRQVWKLLFPKVLVAKSNGFQSKAGRPTSKSDAIEANYRVLKEHK